uniref:Uncharacterized protein n=1 Tax=viral metagenome TaxID=1070528 RepID=A0A6C0I466_9ZZZZ
MDFYTRVKLNNIVKKESPYPMRLKDEGSEKAIYYNNLALATIGELQWEAMKKGRLNWGSIEDEHFRTAELLGQQLEPIPKSELLEKERETKRLVYFTK